MNNQDAANKTAEILAGLLSALSDSDPERKNAGLSMIATMAWKAKLEEDIPTMSVLMAFFIVADTHKIDDELAASNQLESAAKFNRLVKQSVDDYLAHRKATDISPNHSDLN